MQCKRLSGLRYNAVDFSKFENHWIMGRNPRFHNSYDVLENTAWIWRTTCIFPFTLKFTAGVKKYHLNKFYAVYTLSLCIACTLNYTVGIVNWDELFRDPLSIGSATVLMRTTGCHTCMMLCGFWRIIRHKQLTEFIETMAAQDFIFEKMGYRLNYDASAKKIHAYVWTTLVILTIFISYDFCASYLACKTIGIAWILWIIPLIMQVMDITILVSLVALLGAKFRALNEKIKAIVRRANASSPKLIVTADVCAENLRAAAKMHYNICAVGKRVNSFFDWVVIVNVIISFIILSTTLYYIFIEVQREEDTNYVRIGTYMHWEFVHSIPIIIMVATCNWTSSQETHTGKLIHKIRVQKIDSQLYDALKSFSLQLHHQKLDFTAAGFFPLNSTLLQAMVGNITTYLVILIQFQPNLDNM